MDLKTRLVLEVEERLCRIAAGEEGISSRLMAEEIVDLVIDTHEGRRVPEKAYPWRAFSVKPQGA